MEFENQDDIRCCDVGLLECINSASYPFMTNFIKGCIIKMCLELISKRSFKKLWTQMKYHVPRFGLVFGTSAAIYHMMLCLNFRGKFLKTRKRLALLIAGMVSSIPFIIGLKKDEMVLIKLFFFPLLWRCFAALFIESKVIPVPKKHGDIMTYVVLSSIIGFCMMYEGYSSPL